VHFAAIAHKKNKQYRQVFVFAQNWSWVVLRSSRRARSSVRVITGVFDSRTRDDDVGMFIGSGMGLTFVGAEAGP